MSKIYLDQASTSFPKSPSVARAVYDYLNGFPVNVNRGSYKTAYSVEEKIYTTREQLIRLFNFNTGKPKNVIFTPNITTSLNILIKGLLKPGDHVLVSSIEHNAVMRPLNQLKEIGVNFDRIPCTSDGSLILDEAGKLLRPQTKLLVCLHASNVCGTIMPIDKIGQFCKDHGLFFILDTAQTAGTIPVNMEEAHIDALAFTGHKGLRAPQGTGGFLIRDELTSRLTPLISGGTGSISHSEEVPTFMPDRFEPGTPNIPGIIGLGAALNDLENISMQEQFNHELVLTKHFIDGILAMDPYESKIKIIGKKDTSDRCAVVSIQTPGIDMALAAYELDSTYNIMTRVGLHCAPNAHKVLNTYPEGTIRLSFGAQNTIEEVDAALHALAIITDL